MFTGIVTSIGHVIGVTKTPNKDRLLRISTEFNVAQIAHGASIACNGICLTVIDKGKKIDAKDWLVFEASEETVKKTNLAEWKMGTPVNMEQALKVGDELGGHIVSGHVDGTTKIKFRQVIDGSVRYDCQVPLEFARMIAPKGSITLDGVSLTVNDVADGLFSVNIVPYTQRATTFGKKQVGDALNLEVDPMARYVAHYASGLFSNS